MQVKRHCEMCAEPFEAKRPHARYCSERCRKRARRAGAAAKPEPPTITVQLAAGGKSGAAARTWLTARGTDAETVPAAADLLLVADAVDAAMAAGQVQNIAALTRQAAALRAELTRKTDDDEPEGGPSEPPPSPAGPQPGSFDPSSL